MKKLLLFVLCGLCMGSCFNKQNNETKEEVEKASVVDYRNQSINYTELGYQLFISEIDDFVNEVDLFFVEYDTTQVSMLMPKRDYVTDSLNISPTNFGVIIESIASKNNIKEWVVDRKSGKILVPVEGEVLFEDRELLEEYLILYSRYMYLNSTFAGAHKSRLIKND